MNLISYSSEATGLKKITLNRPDKRNALSFALIDQFLIALKEAARDAKVVLIEGAGTNFCSGMDLSELSIESLEKAAHLFLEVASCPVPIVAWTHGVTAAGGIGIMAASDFAYADQGASYILPEIKKGFTPALVVELLKDQVPVRTLIDAAYSGLPLSAERALKMSWIHGIGRDELQTKLDALLKINLQAFSAFKKHLFSERHLKERFEKSLELQRSLL